MFHAIQTPNQYVEVSFCLFELLSSHIPAMMASIKAELDKTNPAEKAGLVLARLLKERAIIQRDLPRPNFDDLSAYECSECDEIERYLAAHPDIKRNMDAMLARFKELLQP